MAAKKIATPYDFLRNEIQNALLHTLSSAPGSPVEGLHYYDSTTKKWYFRTNSAWIDPTDRANHSGTQAWSTLTGTPTTLSGYGITDGQAADADLTAIAALAGTGYAVRTASNTWAQRVFSSTTTALVVTNGTGVSGDTSFAISDVVAAGASGLMTGADKTKLNGIASGATANSSDATLLARANHTGTQTASTISDFDTQVRTSTLNQMAPPTTALSVNSQRITGLANGTGSTDAVTLQQLQDMVAGLSWKDEVRVATTANGTLATAFANGQTIDGITLVTGDRILLKDQSAQTENGIYTVNVSGAPTRAIDSDTGSEISGTCVFVANGTTNAGTRWVCSTTGTISIGSTNITFAAFGGGGSYTNGNGLSLTGNVFSVLADTGISVSGSGVAIDTSVVARKHTSTIGNGSSTSLAVTHSLGNQWVSAQVIEVATLAAVDCDIVRTSTNVCTFNFAVAPTTNQYRVIITG